MRRQDRRWSDLSSSLSLSLSCIELLLFVRVLVGDGSLFGFLQCVAAFIFLLHPVHQQHDQECCEQSPHYTSHYHRCGGRDRGRDGGEREGGRDRAGGMEKERGRGKRERDIWSNNVELILNRTKDSEHVKNRDTYTNAMQVVEVG